MPKYEVPIVHRQLTNYIVEAETRAEAISIAAIKFANAEAPDLLGNEWDEIQTIDAQILG